MQPPCARNPATSARVREDVRQGRLSPEIYLEAFSDGVIAIIITIMVLELKVPHGADWTPSAALPVFLSYVLSFVYVGIYWNNHHHMLHAASASTARSCGPTCTCCSGCRWSRSSPAGKEEEAMIQTHHKKRRHRKEVKGKGGGPYLGGGG